MALGMKKWLGLVAVCMALVALRTLPPKPFELHTERLVETQADRRLKALRADALRTNLSLQRTRWADEIVPATLSSEEPVAFGFPDRAIPRDVERVRERTLAEVKDTPSKVAVGIFFKTYDEGAYPGAPTGGVRNLGEYFFGERDGQPYCVAVRPVWRATRDGDISLSGAYSYESYLGLCSLVRRYGLPGPAVRRWLAHGGSALATTAETAATAVVPSYLFEDLGRFHRRGLFGARPVTAGRQSLVVPMDRCFAGVTEGCAELFLDPTPSRYYGFGQEDVAALTETSPVSAVGVMSFFYPADQFVVAELAAQFGEARFREWWSADGDVGPAFEAAFGTDVGSWYLQRIGRYVTISAPGPGVGGTGLLGAILLLTLSTVLAGGWARRRKVA